MRWPSCVFVNFFCRQFSPGKFSRRFRPPRGIWRAHEDPVSRATMNSSSSDKSYHSFFVLIHHRFKMWTRKRKRQRKRKPAGLFIMAREKKTKIGRLVLSDRDKKWRKLQVCSLWREKEKWMSEWPFLQICVCVFFFLFWRCHLTTFWGFSAYTFEAVCVTAHQPHGASRVYWPALEGGCLIG